MNRIKHRAHISILVTSLLVFISEIHCKDVPSSKKHEDLYTQEKLQQESNGFWAGVIGALAGGAVGYLIGSADSHVIVNYPAVEKFDVYQPELLCPKACRVKYDLDSMAKYGQPFNFYDTYSYNAIAEQEIIVNLYKLGFKLDQIDDSFYTKLAQDNKILSDAGYTIWWNSFKSLERQKDLYLTTSNKIIAYFNRHEAFIKGCQLINYYDTLPSNAYVLPYWIQSSYGYKYKYPLIDFKNKVEADMQKIARFLKRYSGDYVVMRARATERLLQHICCILYNSYAYQQEVEQKRDEELKQKRDDELLVEYQKLQASYQELEYEKLDIARKQAEALCQANELAEERNKLERERNR